jgi:hypothetical protein
LQRLSSLCLGFVAPEYFLTALTVRTGMLSKRQLIIGLGKQGIYKFL